MILIIQRQFPFKGKLKQIHAMKMYTDFMTTYISEHALTTLKWLGRRYDGSLKEKKH